MTKFEGVIPALVTPLNEDESINVPVLSDLIEFLITKKADGFYIGGATGEGLVVKTEQRMILAEESIKAINKRAPAIVQIAAMDFNDAITLAKQAEKCGADCISATPPLFFKYDEDDVFNYYKTLAEAVSIPMMIYYNPAAGFTVNAHFAARAFEVDNITAIKWTSSDYYGMMRLKDLTHGEMNIINGPDEMLLMGLNAGADGGIGTTYNFQIDNIRGVYDSFKDGNIALAQQYQQKANRIIEVLLKYIPIPATKAILEKMGFAVGNGAFPMKRYSAQAKEQLIKEMLEAGLEL